MQMLIVIAIGSILLLVLINKALVSGREKHPESEHMTRERAERREELERMSRR